MTVLEISQGHYRNLEGTPRNETLEMFARDDAEFLLRFPTCAVYHRPCWREFETNDKNTAPWGHEWYVVDEAGLLKMHSAQYDSSG